MYKYSIA